MHTSVQPNVHSNYTRTNTVIQTYICQGLAVRKFSWPRLHHDCTVCDVCSLFVTCTTEKQHVVHLYINLLLEELLAGGRGPGGQRAGGKDRGTGPAPGRVFEGIVSTKWLPPGIELKRTVLFWQLCQWLWVCLFGLCSVRSNVPPLDWRVQGVWGECDKIDPRDGDRLIDCLECRQATWVSEVSGQSVNTNEETQERRL